MRRFVYEIDGLFPPEKEMLGGWGFVANLDCDFALRLREQKRTEHLEQTLQQDSKAIITKFRLDEFGIIKNPLMFVEDSQLILGVVVPGNSCDISLDESSKRNLISGFEEHKVFLAESAKQANFQRVPVRYVPHNVDIDKQAYALASVWINWANNMKMITD